MTVFFIGAGPGAPDLITVRGLRLIERCPVCLYAGSLVPAEVMAAAPEDAHVTDTSSMTLDQIIEACVAAARDGQDVARVHSGDPSVYGAIGEQMQRLARRGIAYEVVPGVPAFAAMAAAMKQELTLPDIAQTVVLTRTAVRSSAMPAGETLENFARTGTTLAIHLSINNLANVVRSLTPHYGPDCPAVVGYRVSWPDQELIRGTLASIRELVKARGITRTALILVGPVLGATNHAESRLYDPAHSHVFRAAD